nr:hypothetical protein [uncultured Oscillibacter sp.]
MANPIRQKEIDERVGKFADKFWGAFQMTENGRVKSTILLYSFCLCWVLLALYGGCFALLNPWLDGLLSGSGLPVWLISLVEALVPAAAGTAAASLVWLLPSDKRLLPAGYLWLTLLMLACLIGLIMLMGWENAGLVLQFFGMFVLAPLALGLGSSLLAYYLYWKKRPPAGDPARPWKRRENL